MLDDCWESDTLLPPSSVLEETWLLIPPTLQVCRILKVKIQAKINVKLEKNKCLIKSNFKKTFETSTKLQAFQVFSSAYLYFQSVRNNS